MTEYAAPTRAATEGPLETAEAPAANREPFSRKVTIDLVAFADVLVIVFAAMAAHALGTLATTSLTVLHAAQTALLGGLLFHILVRGARGYDVSRFHHAVAAFWVVLPPLCLAILAASSLPMDPEEPLRTIAVYGTTWFVIAAGSLALMRVAVARLLWRSIQAGRYDQRIAVFGAGSTARRIRDYLDLHPMGAHFAGVYDDRAASDRLDADGLVISGKLDDMLHDGRRGAFDKVLIALPATADRRIASIAAQLEQLPVGVHVVTHIATDLIEPKSLHSVSALGPVGLLDVKAATFGDWGRIVKRGEDIVLAALFLITLAPLLALIAIAIKLDSGGPVLFRQRRRGRNRTVFEVLKFRTMHVMEDGAEIQQAEAQDPRVTRVGRWLRRSSLDELPQLWNVLRGEMSIVGPRPHAIAHDDDWAQRYRPYARRHQVKPGITGLAQVFGARGQIHGDRSLRERVDQDLEYIANWSLLLDLRIIVSTLYAVARADNAH